MADRPRVAATKLHGPDAGLSYREATEATRGVVSAAERPPPPQVAPSQAGSCAVASQAPPQPAATAEGPPASTEASSIGEHIGQGPSQQRAGDVLRLRGGMHSAAPPAGAGLNAIRHAQPASAGPAQPAGAPSDGGGALNEHQGDSAYSSPYMRSVAGAEQAHMELDRSEGQAGMASQLHHQLAANDIGQGANHATAGPAGRAGGSLPTSPRSPTGRGGLRQRAAWLARQAADLDKESKRVEAQACYLHREAAQLGELAGQKKVKADELELEAAQLEQVADRLERRVAAALEEAQERYQAAEEKQREARQLELRISQLKSEAYQLVRQADKKAAQAERDLPEAEQAARHAEAARSALVQACRDAELLSQRSQQLAADAEKKMGGAAALAQRAFEKAGESFQAKKAALLEASKLEGGQQGAAAGPTTPEVAQHQAQRLAGEWERVQSGRAATELDTWQFTGQAYEKAAHASWLERSAERSP